MRDADAQCPVLQFWRFSMETERVDAKREIGKCEEMVYLYVPQVSLQLREGMIFCSDIGAEGSYCFAEVVNASEQSHLGEV